MKIVPVVLCVGAVFTFMAGGLAVLADQRRTASLRVYEMPGTYELIAF